MQHLARIIMGILAFVLIAPGLCTMGFVLVGNARNFGSLGPHWYVLGLAIVAVIVGFILRHYSDKLR